MAKSDEILELEKITKSITGLNNVLNDTSKIYLAAIKNSTDFNAKLKEVEVTANNLTKAQREAAETQKQLDAANKALAQSEAKLNTFDAQAYEQIQRNNKALADQKKAINDKIKASEAEEGSLVRMRQRLSELTAAYDKSGTRTKASADEIQKLSKEILKAEEATGRHQRDVGNYAKAFEMLPAPIQSVIKGTKSFSAELWELVKNPIVMIIAAIVVVMTTLYEVFTSTASGGKLVKEVMASIGAIFDVLKQMVCNDMGK